MNIRFMTYNVLYGRALNDLERLVKVHSPDILCLQEVETNDKNLERFAKMNYKLADYSNSFIKFGKIYGVATFYNSRTMQFSQSSIIDLPRSIYEMTLFVLRGGNKPRTVLDTVFSPIGSIKKVRVFNTHLTLIALNGSRMKQLRETLDDIPQPDGSAFILTGDFNYIPYARKKLETLIQEYDLEEATKNIDFTLQYSEDGKLEKYNLLQKWGSRLVARLFTNKLKVDYIFYRNVRMLSAKRIDVRYSDHFPILAVFQV